MAAFDLFGLKKGLSPADASHDAPAPRPGLSRKAWLGLAAADALLVLGCAVVVGMRVKGHLTAPPPPPPSPPRRAGGKAGPKPPEAKAPEPKPEAKKTEPEAKPEPPKHEAKPEPKKPEPPKHEPKKREKPLTKEEPKGPVGSPAVNAEPLPKHEAAPTGTAPLKPSLAPSKHEGKKRLTRPVPFTHEDSKAKEVYLVGPFLVRTGGRKTLFKDSKGVWQTTIYLNIGQTYKYRFEVVSESGTKRLTPAQKVEVLDGD